MTRQLAISKRVSLEGVYNWGSGAYAIVTPATYADRIEMSKLIAATPDNETALNYELDTVKKHFVSGEGYFVNENNPSETVLDALTADDLGDLVEVTQKLFIALSGLDASPKDIQTQTATSQMPQDLSEPQTSESNTKTS
jgi:hypothetical protein